MRGVASGRSRSMPRGVCFISIPVGIHFRILAVRAGVPSAAAAEPSAPPLPMEFEAVERQGSNGNARSSGSDFSDLGRGGIYR